MNEYHVLGFLIFLGALFAGGSILFSRLIAPRSQDSVSKLDPYECGSEVIGTARIQFKVGYYLFALIFLIFDVETLFLFPCVVIYKKIAGGLSSIVPSLLFIEVGIFVLILVLGLAYAWRKKALEWD